MATLRSCSSLAEKSGFSVASFLFAEEDDFAASEVDGVASLDVMLTAVKFIWLDGWMPLRSVKGFFQVGVYDRWKGSKE